MTFLLDHDVSSYVRNALRKAEHEVIELTQVLPRQTDDASVFKKAFELGCVMVTCNRHDYLKLAKALPFHGLIIVIRRHPPVLEGRRVLRLLDRAGQGGIINNINFA